MKRIFFLFVSVLAFVFYSCQEKDSTISNPIEQKGFVPLAVGNTWIYDFGVFPDTSTKLSVWQITDKTNIDGVDYFSLSFHNGLLGTPYIVWNKSDGFYMSVDSNKASFFWFKYPVSDNEEYNFTIKTIDGTDSVITAKAKYYNLSIGENNYECIGYFNMTFSLPGPFMFIKENLGIVNYRMYYISQNTMRDTSRYISWELNSYDLISD
ncbi:MAG: hypothetical protein K9J16_18105 [Melioribacteraceae bacterium]|nr:hypothetical protein [Melioribacteraceae bacterium]MCF8356748.1 hypothetical protein [Melioribacteraceae bacterium]MCF8396147.1 hypothetical protein [Melioribacteraceae bacterium]MCF8421124.1 hypothetical protein [Melioribacteraceae bacterium]